MSYILEALRKAQAERAHGAIPGVNAQPVPTIAPHSPISMRAWIAVVLALLTLSAVLFWQGHWSRPEPGLPAVVAQAPQATAPPAPKAATVPDPVSGPAPASTPAPALAPAKPVRKLGERAPGEQAAAPGAPVQAPERIALLQDLPAQIQREIPTLAINGYIYASNPADRSVLINNRLRREGDTLADGFVLEKLLPREMVLNYRGYRYRVSY